MLHDDQQHDRDQLPAVRSPGGHARVCRRGCLCVLRVDSDPRAGAGGPRRRGPGRFRLWRMTAQAVSAPEEEVLHSVQCSQCAGPLSVREGRRILVCRHCGVRVAVKEHGGFSRWYFPPRVNRLKAAAAGAAWLRDYPGIAKRARDARFVDARLIFAPIWEHKALLAGWEFGHILRTETEVVRPSISVGWLDVRRGRRRRPVGTQAGQEGDQGAAPSGTPLLPGGHRPGGPGRDTPSLHRPGASVAPAGRRTGPGGDRPGGRRVRRAK